MEECKELLKKDFSADYVNIELMQIQAVLFICQVVLYPGERINCTSYLSTELHDVYIAK